ncbi:CehA/McbA family metallohydrolase [Fusibacter ferrireducens]|uniref:CehA/McbA family metallohydrolase n=1 Tax=Fusibacter ferrireducens TaxID=2785058 RepID=A0ABR9ZTL5_9FIRM|nr:CehA/McbA family metallohydrolase [Fusibacter ferrireducens]MBF4693820.1 CehA/McbA family metallohydrolase [Fusibacter ferrireducens]
MIKFEQPIKTLYTTQYVDIKAPGRSVTIHSTLVGSCHLYVRIYNPLGEFIGEIVHGHYAFPTAIQFGKEMATMNAMMHEPLEGEYKFEFIVLQAQEPETMCVCTVRIETDVIQAVLDESFYIEKVWFGPSRDLDPDKIVNPESRYYRGDLHGHTTFSDGKMTPHEAINVLEKSKLDFMALTEHNRMPFGHRQSQMLIMPSFELTLPNGHVNIWGVDTADVLSPLLETPENILLKGVKTYRETAIISVNHPFMKPWAYEEKENSILEMDTLEVICDPTYVDAPKANRQAVAFLDWIWEEGYTLFGVGGSDAHNYTWEYYENASTPSIYGDPSTYVFCDGLSIQNLKDGLRNGRCYVSRWVSLDLNIMTGLINPGDGYKGTLDQYEVSLKWHGDVDAPEKFEGRFIYNGRCIQKGILTREHATMSLEQPVSLELANSWIRFGIYDMNGDVVAYVNPVYSTERNKRSGSLGTLMEAFSEDDKGHTI